MKMDACIKTFESSTKEEFHYYLNSTPPLRYNRKGGMVFFFISEPYTADIHLLLVRYGSEYFKGLQSKFIDIPRINELIKNHHE